MKEISGLLAIGLIGCAIEPLETGAGEGSKAGIELVLQSSGNGTVRCTVRNETEGYWMFLSGNQGRPDFSLRYWNEDAGAFESTPGCAGANIWTLGPGEEASATLRPHLSNFQVAINTFRIDTEFRSYESVELVGELSNQPLQRTSR